MFSCLYGLNQDGEVGSCVFSDSGDTLSDKSQSIFQKSNIKINVNFIVPLVTQVLTQLSR